ncbi:MAG: Flp pilus assembly protein CpaB [Thiobacillus sp.]|nr:Flp pilus assembly protein CpaB [Thiobacillus sp.]
MLVALALAGYAWVLSSRMAAEQKAAQPKLQPVVVAQARIPAGSAITKEMLKVSMFPSRPEGSFGTVDPLVGKTVSTDIAVGEAILQERLGGGLRAMLQHIDPSQRAVAIRVDEVIAVGNKLIPGDWVDVFFTLHRNNAEIADTQSQLLLENLQVLAFGSRDVGGAKTGTEGGTMVRTTSESPKTAVLAVTITDIDKLVLAAESGRLLLALRPHEQPEVAAASTDAGQKGDTAKPVAVVAGHTQPPLTLKQLVALTSAASAPVRSPSGKQAPARQPGDAVIVMHGLDEKKVRVAGGGTRP